MKRKLRRVWDFGYEKLPFALTGLAIATVWLLTLFGFRYTPW